MATSVHTVAPRTWVNGEIVTVAQMNTEVRDAMLDMEAPWDAYTSTWQAATTNPTLGNGTLVAAVRQIGKTTYFRLALTMGSTTTYGAGTFSFLLPAAPASGYLANAPIGDVVLTDISASAIMGGRQACLYTTNRVQIVGSTNDRVAAAVPFTWAVGDILQITGVYEAA